MTTYGPMPIWKIVLCWFLWATAAGDMLIWALVNAFADSDRHWRLHN